MIDNNEKQIRAMAAFRQGDDALGNRLQDEFLADIAAAGGDHCACTASCKHHGNCYECVVIHRGHRDHLPVCLHDMINERLERLSALTEHSMCDGRA